MKVRRKSLWRSQNNKLAIKRRNQRAAKERLRLERAARPEPMRDSTAARKPARPRPLFIITITCRDGATERLRIYENLWGGLNLSATRAGRQIAAVVRHYRPAC